MTTINQGNTPYSGNSSVSTANSVGMLHRQTTPLGGVLRLVSPQNLCPR